MKWEKGLTIEKDVGDEKRLTLKFKGLLKDEGLASVVITPTDVTVTGQSDDLINKETTFLVQGGTLNSTTAQVEVVITGDGTPPQIFNRKIGFTISDL